jgi:D-3-phosphoglycerate dehydrogenase
LQYIRDHGCEPVIAESLAEEILVRDVRSVSGIIVRTRGVVNERILCAAPHLRVIGRHGVGTENIDVDAATRHGVVVVNTPEANAESVAEHFMLLALMLSKNMAVASNVARRGTWDQRALLVGQEFFGKTVGLIGLGRVGQRIARICQNAFGCKILFVNRTFNSTGDKLGQQVGLDELLRQSDYVALCVPLTNDTRQMIGGRELSLMKSSGFIINTSNGKVWDEVALYEALRKKIIRGAASDVFACEPTPASNPLLSLDNFIPTPHIAAQTEQALIRMAAVTRDVVRVILGNEPPRFPVNRRPAG